MARKQPLSMQLLYHRPIKGHSRTNLHLRMSRCYGNNLLSIHVSNKLEHISSPSHSLLRQLLHFQPLHLTHRVH
jgi:hypothetical protein